MRNVHKHRKIILKTWTQNQNMLAKRHQTAPISLSTLPVCPRKHDTKNSLWAAYKCNLQTTLRTMLVLHRVLLFKKIIFLRSTSNETHIVPVTFVRLVDDIPNVIWMYYLLTFFYRRSTFRFVSNIVYIDLLYLFVSATIDLDWSATV